TLVQNYQSRFALTLPIRSPPGTTFAKKRDCTRCSTSLGAQLVCEVCARSTLTIRALLTIHALIGTGTLAKDTSARKRCGASRGIPNLRTRLLFSKRHTMTRGQT